MLQEFFKNFTLGLKLYQIFNLIKPQILKALSNTEIIGKNIYGEYTRAFDEKIHEIFVKAVHEHSFPADIISEEGIDVRELPYVIFLDPLDGSLNLARKIPFYAFSLALAKHNKDINLLLGLIWVIPTDTIYIGMKGRGIIRISRNKIEKFTISHRDDKDTLIEVANTDGRVVNEIRKFATIRMLGSIVYSGIKLIERDLDAIIDNSYKLKFTDVASLLIMFGESNIHFSFHAKGDLIRNPRVALVASHRKDLYSRLSKFL